MQETFFSFDKQQKKWTQTPSNEKELIDFGNKMHNCVGWGNYTMQVYKRTSTIVGVNMYGIPSICIELNRDKKIVQALGVCNKVLNNDQKKIVKDWAELKNIDPGVVNN